MTPAHFDALFLSAVFTLFALIVNWPSRSWDWCGIFAPIAKEPTA